MRTCRAHATLASPPRACPLTATLHPAPRMRPRRKRKLVAAARDRSEDRIHEPRRAALPYAPRQVDRVVHDRCRGYAGEMEQLIGAEPKNRDDLRIDASEITLGICGD